MYFDLGRFIMIGVIFPMLIVAVIAFVVLLIKRIFFKQKSYQERSVKVA